MVHSQPICSCPGERGIGFHCTGSALAGENGADQVRLKVNIGVTAVTGDALMLVTDFLLSLAP
jgi:hypothetical protein